jgi:maltose-binding protein MalE
MKTKLTIIAVVAVTLLSFTVTTSKKSEAQKTKSEAKSNQSGFALQDKDQF